MPLTQIDHLSTPDEAVFLVVFEMVALGVALVVLVRTAAKVLPRFGASRNPATWGPALATIRAAREREHQPGPIPLVWQDRWTVGYETSARQWASLVASTEVVDRPTVERAANDVYRAFGEPVPFVHVWVRSPREAVIAGRLLCGFLEELHQRGPPVQAAWSRAVDDDSPPHPDPTWESVVRLVGGQLPRRVPWAWQARTPFERRRTSFPRLGPAFGFIDHALTYRDPELAAVHRDIHAAVGDGADLIAAAISYQLAQEGGDPPVMPARQQRNAPHEVGCLGAMAGLIGGAMRERIAAVAALAAGCGGWLPLDGAVVFIDRPIEMACDERGWPHRATGPAIRYGDGWRIWVADGAVVPQAAVEDPEGQDITAIQAERDPRRRRALVHLMGEQAYRARVGATAQAISAEPDTALQRELMAAFGQARYMLEVGRVVHRDTDGLGHPRRLWQAPRRGDMGLMFVEVMNSTPEPDGSTRTFWLRVPPHMRTCQAAVAWTFGLGEADYVLDRES